MIFSVESENFGWICKYGLRVCESRSGSKLCLIFSVESENLGWICKYGLRVCESRSGSKLYETFTFFPFSRAKSLEVEIRLLMRKM